MVINNPNALITYVIVIIALYAVNKTILTVDRVKKIHENTHLYFFFMVIFFVICSTVIISIYPTKTTLYLINFLYALTFLGILLILDRVIETRIIRSFINKSIDNHFRPLYIKILANISCELESRYSLPVKLKQIPLIELMKYDIDNKYSDIVNLLIDRYDSDNLLQLGIEWEYVYELDIFSSYSRCSCEWLETVKSHKMGRYKDTLINNISQLTTTPYTCHELLYIEKSTCSNDQ